MSVASKLKGEKFETSQLQPKIIGSTSYLLSQTDFASSENLLSSGLSDDEQIYQLSTFILF